LHIQEEVATLVLKAISPFKKGTKGKDVPLLLTENHAIKVYWVSGGTASCILDLGTRWR
jgi:hypothetical protein